MNSKKSIISISHTGRAITMIARLYLSKRIKFNNQFGKIFNSIHFNLYLIAEFCNYVHILYVFYP
jgi:hypothetical protein